MFIFCDKSDLMSLVSGNINLGSAPGIRDIENNWWDVTQDNNYIKNN